MTRVVCIKCGGPIEFQEVSLAFPDGFQHRNGDCDYAPFQYFRMPNGSEVWYRDSDHSYWSEIQRKAGKWTGIASARIPSPSQIAKYADPSPDKLMDWAARKQVEGVYRLGTIDNFSSPADVHAALKKNKLTWRDLRSQAGDVGTAVHDAFEKGLHGTPVPLEGNTPAEQQHLIALDRFFVDHLKVGPQGGIKPLQTETVVYSAEHGFAGRFDARVLMPVQRADGLWEDKAVLLDLKTSKFIGRAYHAQLHGYDLAAEESGYGASDRLLILQTRDDGTYRLWPCRSSREVFLHALALWRAGKECDRQTREDYKAVA